jgi:branched-chain amino acid transport system substrate-binding protein
VEDLLVRYRERAGAAGVDPLGLYIPPYAYAELQILEAAINFAKTLDDAKLTATIKATTGKIKFGARGEWTEPRLLRIQYRGIRATASSSSSRQAEVILYPPQYKSAELAVPFESASR